jgi:hypothetical protein
MFPKLGQTEVVNVLRGTVKPLGPAEVQLDLGDPYHIPAYDGMRVRIQEQDPLNRPAVASPPLINSSQAIYGVEWAWPRKDDPDLTYPLEPQYSVSNPQWAEASQQRVFIRHRAEARWGYCDDLRNGR